VQEINTRGPYLHIYNFLQQYLTEGKEPTGTVIVLSSGAASFTQPGMSAYAISKLIEIRLIEFLHIGIPHCFLPLLT
jgi:NAD(P)-dependent dehydrogenase (short-subunit alcohol dehydrogenase family)